MAKPEDYGSRAAPFEDFLKVLAEGVARYNAREGRQTLTAQGRSFNQTFAESYATAPIRKASTEQLRLALMHSELRPAEKETGAVTILGNRYWTDVMPRLAGKKVSVRFDPDDLHAGVEIYQADGRWFCHAPVIEALGFQNADASRTVAAARSAWRRKARAALDAERTLTAAEVAAKQASVEGAEPLPETKVVRMVASGGGRDAAPIDDAEDAAFSSNFTAALLKFEARREDAEAD